MMIQDFKKDLEEIQTLIMGKTPFCLMRFADGEIGVLQGKYVHGSDDWISPNYRTKLSYALETALTREDPKIYYGISCKCCDERGKEYLLGLIKNPMNNLTFSNIFVNGNYNEFLKFLLTIQEDIVLIANHKTNIEKFPLTVSTFLPVPDDCVTFWEEYDEQMKAILNENFKSVVGKLFLVSAGPMSEAIIDYLWEINPNNRYVDVGSSIAEFVHGKPIREFAYSYSQYNSRNCNF